jgi:hypothetical protein
LQCCIKISPLIFQSSQQIGPPDIQSNKPYQWANQQKKLLLFPLKREGFSQTQTSELISLRSDSTSFTWLSSGVASRFPVLEEPFAEKSRVARDSGDRGISSNLDWSPLQVHNMMAAIFCFADTFT